MKYIELGHGIEGLNLTGDARRVEFKQGSLRRHPVTGTLMVIYELDRNIELNIDRSCDLSDDEKLLRDKHLIHYDSGDCIIADASRLFIESKKNSLAIQVKEGVSGRHGASLISTQCHAIAIIKTPLSIYGNKLITQTSSIKSLLK